MQARSIVAAALALLAAHACAEAAEGCDAFKWPIARERSAFATPGLEQVTPGKPLPGIMDPAIVKLQPVGDVSFVVPPGHKPRPDSFGTVVKAPPLVVGGTYQVTLSDDAWIDMIQNGRSIRSSAFSGVKGCPEVRKSVRFELGAGEATIQISGAAADSIKVDLLPAE